MARVADDIVHYFRQKGIDILYSQTIWTHCHVHEGGVMEALGRRTYPMADLIRAVVEGEQHVRLMEEQLRSLWSDKRTLSLQLEQLTRDRKENHHA
jgi:hypothetical protein